MKKIQYSFSMVRVLYHVLVCLTLHNLAVLLKIDYFLLCRREKGAYYALDLGGTNFRVLRVQLGGQRSSILDKDVDRQAIPQHLMTGSSEVTEVFPFLVASISTLLIHQCVCICDCFLV